MHPFRCVAYLVQRDSKVHLRSKLTVEDLFRFFDNTIQIIYKMDARTAATVHYSPGPSIHDLLVTLLTSPPHMSLAILILA